MLRSSLTLRVTKGRLTTENLRQLIMAELKDLAQFVFDEQSANQFAAEDAKVNGIANQRSSINLLELMRVFPQTVRAAQLSIDELKWWLPNGDLRTPPNRNSPHLQSVVDESSFTHHDWGRRQNPELQRWWCDGLKILGV